MLSLQPPDWLPERIAEIFRTPSPIKQAECKYMTGNPGQIDQDK